LGYTAVIQARLTSRSLSVRSIPRMKGRTPVLAIFYITPPSTHRWGSSLQGGLFDSEINVIHSWHHFKTEQLLLLLITEEVVQTVS
jgi:hypothetical protein